MTVRPRRRRLVAPARAPRRCAGSNRGDRGAAIVEFVFLAALLLVPVGYGVLAVFAVERAGYAMVAAARSAARAVTLTGNCDGGRGGPADTAADVALRDYGLTVSQVDQVVAVAGSGCGAPDAVVRVTDRYAVALPFLPGVLGRWHPVRVTSTQTMPFGGYRSTG